MDERGAVTDQLADVIRIAQLVRKTGLLIAERDGGSGLEEGKITFVNGLVTDAVAGHMKGSTAFNWLNTWGTCRFIFMPLSSSPSEPLVTTTGSLGRSTDPLLSSAPVGIAPYRIQDVNEALPRFNSMGLTRAHRHLFLLIDGQRSVPELIRLSARDPKEVRKLLTDLERAGLIQQ